MLEALQIKGRQCKPSIAMMAAEDVPALIAVAAFAGVLGQRRTALPVK